MVASARRDVERVIRGAHHCCGSAQVSEATGCVILPDIAAYLECTVLDRMEAGDHWVVYCRVDGGQVVDEGAVSAVHQRKTGTTY